MIRELVEISRPGQWYKNLVIFAAIFFSGNLFDIPMLLMVIVGFFSLCLLSSASYSMNDIIDAERDRHHHKKRHRPVASGRLSKEGALLWALLLYAGGFAMSWFIGWAFSAAAISLLFLMVLYNLFFKNIAFAEIAILSTNFMVRAVAGAVVISVAISPWLPLGAYAVALFLSSAKRKSDLEYLGENAKNYKKIFEVYSAEILNGIILMSSVILFIIYALYAFLGTNVHQIAMMATIPIVFFLIFRYYYFAFAKNEIARDPEKVFLDKQMLTAMFLWAIIFFISIYHGKVGFL